MISDELKSFIGKMYAPAVREVEKGAIRRYAEAVENDNPLHSNEEYARKSRYGTIIAQPGFFGWELNFAWGMQAASSEEGLPGLIAALVKAGFWRILDGGISYEFYLPVRAGDTLIESRKVKDIYEREGKGGAKMIMSIFERTYINQNGDLVANAQQTLIAR